MLHAAQRSTLDYICGRECIRSFFLTRADIWVLHLFLDMCRTHGKKCVFAETTSAVRILQTGEATTSTGEAVAVKITQRRVSQVVREIAGHNVRSHFCTVTDESKTELSTELFRSSGRAASASPIAPSAAAAAAAAAAASELEGFGRLPLVMEVEQWWGQGDMVDVLSRTGVGFNPPKEQARALVLRVHSDGSCDVAYLKGLGRRTELNVEAKYIGPKPDDAGRSKEQERLRQSVVASRQRVDVLLKQVHLGRAAAKRHAEALASTRAELTRSKADFNSILRGGEGGSLTREGRAVVAAVRAAGGGDEALWAGHARHHRGGRRRGRGEGGSIPPDPGGDEGEAAALPVEPGRVQGGDPGAGGEGAVRAGQGEQEAQIRRDGKGRPASQRCAEALQRVCLDRVGEDSGAASAARHRNAAGERHCQGAVGLDEQEEEGAGGPDSVPHSRLGAQKVLPADGAA